MSRRFRGESHHKVDAKGRVSIPASFRRVIEASDPLSARLAELFLDYAQSRDFEVDPTRVRWSQPQALPEAVREDLRPWSRPSVSLEHLLVDAGTPTGLLRHVRR